MSNLRTKIEEAIDSVWCGAMDCSSIERLTEKKYIAYKTNATKKALDQICTIFKEELEKLNRFSNYSKFATDGTDIMLSGTELTKKLDSLINSLEEGKRWKKP